ncbi:hypothetical protein J6590_051650 [Homalodisca vitripennis]|nr:hypothetical protein J6590_051650 [Homalodisca vitripennis]
MMGPHNHFHGQFIQQQHSKWDEDHGYNLPRAIVPERVGSVSIVYLVPTHKVLFLVLIRRAHVTVNLPSCQPPTARHVAAPWGAEHLPYPAIPVILTPSIGLSILQFQPWIPTLQGIKNHTTDQVARPIRRKPLIGLQIDSLRVVGAGGGQSAAMLSTRPQVHLVINYRRKGCHGNGMLTRPTHLLPAADAGNKLSGNSPRVAQHSSHFNSDYVDDTPFLMRRCWTNEDLPPPPRTVLRFFCSDSSSESTHLDRVGCVQHNTPCQNVDDMEISQTPTQTPRALTFVANGRPDGC